MAFEITDEQGNSVLLPDTIGQQPLIPSMITQQMAALPQQQPLTQSQAMMPSEQGGLMSALAMALSTPQMRQLLEPPTPTTLPNIPSSQVVGLGPEQVSEVHRMVQQDKQISLAEKLRQKREFERQVEAERDRQQRLKFEMMKLKNEEMAEEIKARREMAMERMRQEGRLSLEQYKEQARAQREQAAAQSKAYRIGNELWQMGEDGQFRRVAAAAPPPARGGGGGSGGAGTVGVGWKTLQKGWHEEDGQLVYGHGIWNPDTGEKRIARMQPPPADDKIAKQVSDLDAEIHKLQNVIGTNRMGLSVTYAQAEQRLRESQTPEYDPELTKYISGYNERYAAIQRDEARLAQLQQQRDDLAAQLEAGAAGVQPAAPGQQPVSQPPAQPPAQPPTPEGEVFEGELLNVDWYELVDGSVVRGGYDNAGNFVVLEQR